MAKWWNCTPHQICLQFVPKLRMLVYNVTSSGNVCHSYTATFEVLSSFCTGGLGDTNGQFPCIRLLDSKETLGSI